MDCFGPILPVRIPFERQRDRRLSLRFGKVNPVKTLAYIILSILMIGAVAYCIYRYRAELGVAGSGGNQVASNPDNSSPQPPRITWQTIDRTPDGFKADMPAGASEIQVPAYTGDGGQEPVEMLQASASDSTYAIAWADNPPVKRASSDGARAHRDDDVNHFFNSFSLTSSRDN